MIKIVHIVAITIFAPNAITGIHWFQTTHLGREGTVVLIVAHTFLDASNVQADRSVQSVVFSLYPSMVSAIRRMVRHWPGQLIISNSFQIRP
jgi:hypothetical protein